MSKKIVMFRVLTVMGFTGVVLAGMLFALSVLAGFWSPTEAQTSKSENGYLLPLDLGLQDPFPVTDYRRDNDCAVYRVQGQTMTYCDGPYLFIKPDLSNVTQ